MMLKDIMTKNVLTLSPNDSIEEAAKLLVENDISGAPVVDAFNNVIGILTEGDLVRKQKPLTNPFIFTFLDAAIPLNFKQINEDLEAITAMTVAQLMTDNVISMKEYEEVADAADLMISNKINRIPVINEDGELLGIVTRQDVIRAVYIDKKDEAE